MSDHQRFLQVEFNTISKLWEVRVDGYKQFESKAFIAAEHVAHQWRDDRPSLDVFLSFDKTGA
jgi:hypothetical protein